MTIKNIISIISISFVLFACGTNKNSANLDPAIKSAHDYLEYYSNNNIDKKAEYHYINGLTEQQKGNWAESIIDFNQALEYDSNATVLYSMSKSYSQLNRLNLSLKTLLESLKLHPEFIPALELLSATYFSLNDVANALRVSEKIVQIDPTYSRKLHLAEIYEYYNPPKAGPLYEELYSISKDTYILKKLTELYSYNPNSTKYKNLIEELYFSNPSNINVGLDLMDNYISEKKFDEAINLLNIVDKNIPTEKLNIFYGTLAYNLLNEKDIDSTIITNFNARIDNRFIFDWKIQMLTGYLEARIFNFPKTFKRFNQAIKLNDSSADIRKEIGSYYLQLSQVSESKKIFEEAIADFPLDPEIYYLYGISLEIHDEKQAIANFEHALKLNPKFLEPNIQLGIIYDRLGINDKSDFYYEKALEISPTNPLVNNNYAYSLSVRGIKLDKALEMVKIALRKQPNTASYIDTYAWILYQKGRYSEALRSITDAIEIGGANAEIYEHLGDILKALDRNIEAKEAYQNALKIEPDRESALESIKSLE